MQRFSAEERQAAAILAQQDLYFFTRWMFLQRKGFNWLRAAHHKIVCDALMRVFRGECKRLIINIPPRYSKTEIAVINFIAWALGKVPDAEFIHTSYSGKLATGNAWQTRELVNSVAYRSVFPGTLVRVDSSAKDDWKTTAGGCVYAVGANGSITGYGAGKHREGFGGAIIIDDPHKADEARSDPVRQGIIDWFQNTLESRKNSPDTPIIVIMQRLHELDLAGWLLGDRSSATGSKGEPIAGGNGEVWEHVCLSAWNGDDTPLWPEKHSAEDLRRMELAAPYTFAGQYRQQPAPPAGNIFRPGNIEIIDALPVDEQIDWVRGWDFAATQAAPGKDPDWTAGGRLGKGRSGRYYIAHVERMRGGPDEVRRTLKNTTDADGKGVKVSIPQDPGQAGKSQALDLVRLLDGYTVNASPESGDKILRAEGFAAQVNIGNVSMVRGEWNTALTEEMRNFPNGKHDDQVDAFSRAYSKFVQPGTTGMLDYLRQQAERLEAEKKRQQGNQG